MVRQWIANPCIVGSTPILPSSDVRATSSIHTQQRPPNQRAFRVFERVLPSVAAACDEAFALTVGSTLNPEDLHTLNYCESRCRNERAQAPRNH